MYYFYAPRLQRHSSTIEKPTIGNESTEQQQQQQQLTLLRHNENENEDKDNEIIDERDTDPPTFIKNNVENEIELPLMDRKCGSNDNVNVNVKVCEHSRECMYVVGIKNDCNSDIDKEVGMNGYRAEEGENKGTEDECRTVNDVDFNETRKMTWVMVENPMCNDDIEGKKKGKPLYIAQEIIKRKKKREREKGKEKDKGKYREGEKEREKFKKNHQKDTRLEVKDNTNDCVCGSKDCLKSHLVWSTNCDYTGSRSKLSITQRIMDDNSPFLLDNLDDDIEVDFPEQPIIFESQGCNDVNQIFQLDLNTTLQLDDLHYNDNKPRSVVLRKTARDPRFGFSVQRIDDMILVSFVVPGGLAESMGLKMGEHLLMCNGMQLSYATTTSVLSDLNQLKCIDLLVRRCPFETTITILRSEGQQLGLVLTGSKIKSVSTDSLSAQHPIPIGSYLIEINHTNVIGINGPRLQNVMANAGEKITLSFMPCDKLDCLLKRVGGVLAVRRLMDCQLLK
eukprot:Ihof_evm2s322 gene=Ihof_evmTU2s322